MANFDFTLDETAIGTTIGPPDGYLVSLLITTPPNDNDPPRWDEGRGRWLSRYLQHDVLSRCRQLETAAQASSWWQIATADPAASRLVFFADLLTESLHPADAEVIR
jgi:hypothetical protein